MKGKAVWLVIVNLLIVALFAMIGHALSQDVPVFHTNDWVQITWTAPEDTDIVKYTAYFVCITGNMTTTVMDITTWNSEDVTQLKDYKISLSPGQYELYVTAWDPFQESDPSQAFTFEVKDGKPGSPVNVIMQIIQAQSAIAAPGTYSFKKLPAPVANARVSTE